MVTMSSCFDRLWEPRCLQPADIEVPGPVLGWNGQRKRMVWCDLAGGELALGEALGQPVNRIGQRGGIKEGLIQTSFSCLIEWLCNEGEVRNPDTEKV